MTSYVFLCDSPELDSGFANVGRNILDRLNIPSGSQLFVWGLGHDNVPYQSKYPIYSGGINTSWRDSSNIKRFYDFLSYLEGDVVLVTINDCFRLSDLSKAIDEIRKIKPLKIISYIPVDSYLTSLDMPFIQRVDIFVSYTDFGKSEIEKYTDRRVYRVYHGLEKNSFSEIANRGDERKRLFPSLPENAKLLVNVNSNSQRKAPDKTMEILEQLLKFDQNYYLYMHMSPLGHVNLKEFSDHLGISHRMIFADPFFDNDKFGKTLCSSQTLNSIYNSADLYISTSCGEGWGLTAFEAGLCGTPVAVPNNTAYKELFSEECCLFLPSYGTEFFMEKRWPVVDVINSAKIIHKAFSNNTLNDKKANMKKLLSNDFDWDAIAEIWNDIICR